MTTQSVAPPAHREGEAERIANGVASQPGEPMWAVAEVFPLQGDWSEAEYLAFTNDINRLVELSDGFLEMLPMPTDQHQGTAGYLYDELRAFGRTRGGVVRFAPLRIQLRSGKFREPDMVYLVDRDDPRRGAKYWMGADLVMEVVSDSPQDRERDLVTKRREYAEAGIAEYWIVDPETESITVLTLVEDSNVYAEHDIFVRGETATSVLLAGFAVSVNEVLDVD